MKRDDRKEIEEERFDMSAGTRLENYCAKYSTQAPHLFHTLQLQFSSSIPSGDTPPLRRVIVKDIH